MSPEEQRRGPRVVRHFMVRFRNLRVGEPEWRASPVQDLSSGGARFLAQGAFRVGDTLEMQLLLPNAPQPVALQARITRSTAGPMGMVELGVAFESLDPAAQRAIDETVAWLLRKQKEA